MNISVSKLSLLANKLLNKEHHLSFLDGTVFVEDGKDFLKCFLFHFFAGTELAHGVIDELFGLFLIEDPLFINIISFPELVNDILDGLLFGGFD